MSHSRARITLIATVLLWALPPATHALIYTYDNTTAGALSSGATPCNNPLARTFTVTDSFTVSTIAVGLNLSHTNRGDIRATLVAPNSTSLQLFNNSGDTDNNYDILISSNTEGALDDNDTDPTAEPYYNRLVSVAGINFYTGNSAGTWTLQLCDNNNNGINGTFNRAHLVLTSTQTTTTTATSTVTYDWGSNGNNTAFSNITLNGVTITQTGATSFNGSGGQNFPAVNYGQNFRTNTTASLGNHTGFFNLYMVANAPPDSESKGEQAIFTFSSPARDLQFTYLDVDFLTGDFEDQYRVVGTDANGAVVPYTLTIGSAHQIAGDIVEADAQATDTTGTNGNATVRFEGAVSTLQIDYMQGDDPAAANNISDQWTGFSDFTFVSFDYGDAPSSYGTNLAGGARHVLGSRNLYLGTNPPDGESDGQAGVAATTDDTTQVGGVDDEDGVASFPQYGGGSTYTVSVTANNRSSSAAATLVGYIDWNRDGDFADADEISASVNVPANTVNGAFNVTWSNVPANAGGTTATYARFRISFTASEVTSPTGLATSGEVEDYPIPEDTLPVTLAFFHAEQTATGVVARWATETETATVGYLLAAPEDLRRFAPIAGSFQPSRQTDSLAPQSYSVQLESFRGSSLFLLDYDTRGRRTVHGPFEVGRIYGAEPTPTEIDWRAIAESADGALQLRNSDKGGATSNGFPVVNLAVSKEGIHRVRFEELLAAGFDLTGAPVARLALTRARGGAAVPMFVQGSSARPELFGPGGFVEFVGQPPTGSLYTLERNYRLSVTETTGLRPEIRRATPDGTSALSYLASSSVEKDLVYSFAAPNGDPWYEVGLLAFGGATSRTFTIPVDALAGDAGRLVVELWGVTNWDGDAPDHHLRIELNGTFLADDRFDGLTARRLEIDLPAGLLREGDNELTLQLPGDTGFEYDLVHVDRYEIQYPRPLNAISGRLDLTGVSGGITAEEFSSSEVVGWARSGAARLKGVVTTASGNGFRARLTLPVIERAGERAYLADTTSLLRPRITAAREVPADLLVGSGQYLIISHPAFLDHLGPLVAAKQAQGLTVKTVDVLDLYARYTGGEPDPAAIRRYVAAAANRIGTRYVLLVGGDTYDTFDRLGLGSISFIPTLYAQTDDLIHFAPADPLFGDTDQDGVPDLAVGRLPARTPEELTLLIDKILDFPSTPAAAVFAADGSHIREFSTVGDQLTALTPRGWSRTTAYIDDLGISAARQTLLSAFSSGAALVSFVGHSGPTVWSFQNLFGSSDVNGLNNSGAPALVVQWGCWNTYHVAPQYDTLAHRFLLAGPQGAAAVLGSATLSKSTSDQILGPRVQRYLFNRGMTIGDAVIAAKRDVAGQGDLRDVLIGWTLLGDPAMVLNP